MKVVRYEWEDKYIVTQLNKNVFAFDNLNSSSMFDKLKIETNINTNKNIDFAKLLSFNFVFSNKKSYLSLKENVDKNPLKIKLTNKKNLNSNIFLDYKTDINFIKTISYVYYIYIINLFKSKNISLSSEVGLTYNTKLVELNSILKVGHCLNILDIDPVVNISFSTILNKSSLKSYIHE